MEGNGPGRADQAPGRCWAGEGVAWRQNLTGRFCLVHAAYAPRPDDREVVAVSRATIFAGMVGTPRRSGRRGWSARPPALRRCRPRRRPGRSRGPSWWGSAIPGPRGRGWRPRLGTSAAALERELLRISTTDETVSDRIGIFPEMAVARRSARTCGERALPYLCNRRDAVRQSPSPVRAPRPGLTYSFMGI